MAQIKSGASSDLLTVDPTSKAARGTIYDTSGNVLCSPNRTAVAETAGGIMLAGKDYKLLRTLRASSIGTLRSSDDALFLYDSFEGTTRNLNAWIETATTMTSAQTLATGLRLNTAGTTTTTTGILESSHRQFPVIARTGIVFRARLRYQGATNCVEEWGFSDQSSATAATHNNGAFFRRDAAGSLQPVLAFNGVETQGTTFASPPSTSEYSFFEIFLEDDRATFQILNAAGVLIGAQVMERGSSAGGAGVTTQARLFAVTHLPCFFRVLNTGAAGTAPQIDVTECSVIITDSLQQRSWRDALSGMGYNALSSPTAYTQLANYANSAAPASATLSNTAAGYTTLGGQWQFAAAAGAETDYALFGFTNPSPYTLYVTSVAIAAWVQAIAIATTSSVLQWGIAANSSAVSLATAAPYSPMRKGIGVQSATVGTPVGDMFNPGNLLYMPQTPDAVQPGRFFHVILKIPIATATGSQIIRGVCMIDGYFE